MKRDFNAWLKTLGDTAPVKTLTELRQWNIAHQRAGAIKYGQANLDVSDEMDLQADRAQYEADRAQGHPAVGDAAASTRRSRRNRLDALLFPGVSSANIGGAARLSDGDGAVRASLRCRPGTGANAFPAGFEPKPAPYGVSFTGPACSEPKLIALAFAFEQATKRRVAPPLFP